MQVEERHQVTEARKKPFIPQCGCHLTIIIIIIEKKGPPLLEDALFYIGKKSQTAVIYLILSLNQLNIVGAKIMNKRKKRSHLLLYYFFAPHLPFMKLLGL